MAERPTDSVFDICRAAIEEGELTGPRPTLLHHLTDLEGLCGILATRSLRASLATALNDALEVWHGTAIAVELVEERLRRRTTPFDLGLLAFLQNPSAVPSEVRYEISPMVASFCSRCDGSGQWLHYGRSGRGVAIGFAPELAEAVSYDLVRVDYSPASQRSRMARLIEAGARAVASYTREAPANGDLARREVGVAHIVSLHVPLLAVRMKHPSFREEDEWRLVAHVLSLNGVRQDVTGDPTPLKFRKSGERLVPYEELPFTSRAEDLLKEIVVGYSSDTSPDAVRLIAQEHKLRPAVMRSDVPVR
jgi:Protein of unknown function (DUF2971)